MTTPVPPDRAEGDAGHVNDHHSVNAVLRELQAGVPIATHATSHYSGGSDQLDLGSLAGSLPQAQVTNLTTDLAGKSPLGSAFRPVIRTNAYIQCPVYNGANIGTFTMVEARQYFIPLWVPRDLSIDRLACSVSTQGGTGSLIRLGLYANTISSGQDQPGTLVVDGGTVDSAASTGDKTVSFTSTPLTAGLYWLSACQQGAATGNAVLVGGFNFLSAWNQAVFTTGSCALVGLYAASITGAFASNPTITSVVTSAPRVLARVA